jgi:hypothetical protein
VHAGIEGILSGMAKRGVAKIMGQSDGFTQIFIQIKNPRDGAANLGDLNRMRQASAKHIAFMVNEDLGFIFQTAESRRMDNSVAVALILTAIIRRFFGELPPA